MTDKTFGSSSENEETSLSLLELAKENEGNAWQILVDLYGPVIYARCRYKWKLEATEAENAGQEVFAAIAKKLRDFDRQRTGSFRRWLRIITDNKCKDLLRKKQVTRGTGGSEAKEKLNNVADGIDGFDDYEDSSDKAVLIRQAMKAVEGQFSARDCKIFWAIAVDDKDRGDIAQLHSITTNSVYVSYSRVRKRLREVYQDLIDDDV